MFCRNCGEYIRGQGHYCERCKEMLVYSNGLNVDKEIAEEIYVKHDKSGMGLVFISFVVPIIGIILYFINKAHLPRKSHVIMASTIIGCATWCVALLLFNIVHGMNIDIFSSFQEIISGSI